MQASDSKPHRAKVVYRDGERLKTIEGRVAFESDDWIHVQRDPEDTRPDRVVEVHKRTVDRIERLEARA